MKRIDVYCGNHDCPTRQKGELFPVCDDGIHLWEMHRSTNDSVKWVLGDCIPDGRSWFCPDCLGESA